jgi:hypothetical protein
MYFSARDTAANPASDNMRNSRAWPRIRDQVTHETTAPCFSADDETVMAASGSDQIGSSPTFDSLTLPSLALRTRRCGFLLPLGSL